ncbi:hypothetical protein ZHAS_00015123 [Anopheles sinensis]|uniref:Uncharacterized protein n=1 Tax=Anopheles sinensis TaxID=74873 RepID=A0A084WA35_ANOSI|nr:hypothetical protein ZHAS_00015123 [Anopheles sinensis]
MQPTRATALWPVVLLVLTVGSVAPADPDPISSLLDIGGFGSVGGKAVSGPISIRDSIVGDIISINVKVTNTTRITNVSAELVQVLVCALNQYGDYGIEMADVRRALAQYLRWGGKW